MGAAEFNREDFIPRKGVPGRTWPFVLALVLMGVVLIVAGFVAYEFVASHKGISMMSGRSTELTEIEKRLAAMEHRIGQIEKRRRNAGVEPLVPEQKEQDPAEKKDTASSGIAARIVYPRSQRTERQQNSSVSGVPMQAAQVSGQSSEVSSLQKDLKASREEWEAITNRLGSVVGELGSQRSEIDSHKETLNVLLDRSERQLLPFSLQKKLGWMRVGPVVLWLRSTDPGSGRYTLRLQINDSSIELKDRVVHEALELYTPGSAVPIELIVNSIGRNEASGNLAVPQDHPLSKPNL